MKKKLMAGALTLVALLGFALSAQADGGGCTITTYPDGSKLISCHITRNTPTPTPTAAPTPTGDVQSVAVHAVPVPATGGSR